MPMPLIMRGFKPSKDKRVGPAILAAAAMVMGATCAQAAEQPKQLTSIWQQDTLTGDWGGTRTTLKDKGIEFTLVYIGETFAVLSGGIDRRASYEGRFEFTVDSNLEKLIGWTGANTHFTIYQLHNSGQNVATMSAASPTRAISTGSRQRGCSLPGLSRVSTTASRCASASSPPTMSS
jgi:porin